MGEFSITHILIVAIVLLVFFGPSRLPGLGQSLGKSIRGFKDALNEDDRDAKKTDAHAPQRQEAIAPSAAPNVASHQAPTGTTTGDGHGSGHGGGATGGSI